LFFETFVQSGQAIYVAKMQTSIVIVRNGILSTFALIVLKCLMVSNMAIIKLDM